MGRTKDFSREFILTAISNSLITKLNKERNTNITENMKQKNISHVTPPSPHTRATIYTSHRDKHTHTHSHAHIHIHTPERNEAGKRQRCMARWKRLVVISTLDAERRG